MFVSVISKIYDYTSHLKRNDIKQNDYIRFFENNTGWSIQPP